jgi:hypothetical protein
LTATFGLGEIDIDLSNEFVIANEESVVASHVEKAASASGFGHGEINVVRFALEFFDDFTGEWSVWDDEGVAGSFQEDSQLCHDGFDRFQTDDAAHIGKDRIVAVVEFCDRFEDLHVDIDVQEAVCFPDLG